MRADNEFLNSFQWKLHHRAAYSVVLVIDPVDRDVHITTARTIRPKHCNAVLGGVIRVNWLGTWSEISEIPKVSTIERQVLNVAGSDVYANVSLLFAHQLCFAGSDRHVRCLHTRIHRELQSVGLADQQLNIFRGGIAEAAGIDLNIISTGREQVDLVFSVVIGGCGPGQSVGFVCCRYGRTSDHRLVLIDDGSRQRSARSCLRGSAAESNGYEGQKKGYSGQSFEHFSR